MNIKLLFCSILTTALALADCAPPPPANLTAQLGQCPAGQVCVQQLWVRLNWTDVARNETGYTVERATLNPDGSAGAWALLATLPRNSAGFSDWQPLTSAAVYRVSAVSKCGAGQAIVRFQ